MKVTVVIPAYNEERLLPHTLNTLKNQDYPEKFEIVVCDNNSSDKTSQIAKSFGARVILERRKGSSFAYDTGMRNAKGDLILVTNADTLLPRNWISSIVREFEKSEKIVGVGTKVEFYNSPKWVNIALKSLDKLNPLKAMWGVSMACRRETFEKVGGFILGVNNNEDALFSLKLKEYGEIRIIDDIYVKMDGRRFNDGFFNALKAWHKSFGSNALIITFNYLIFKKIEGKFKDFEDIRK